MKRVLYLIELIVFHNIFYEKRPTKETDIYEKRGICMKRDQLFLKSIVNHTVCLEQRPTKKTCMYEKCPQKKPVYMKRGLQKRPTNEMTCIYATRVILSYICNDICYESHTRSLSTERDMKFFANQTVFHEQRLAKKMNKYKKKHAKERYIYEENHSFVGIRCPS